VDPEPQLVMQLKSMQLKSMPIQIIAVVPGLLASNYDSDLKKTLIKESNLIKRLDSFQGS